MNPVRIAIVAGALVAAIALALLLRNVLSSHKPAVVIAAAPIRASVRVLVAARDLDTGTRLAGGDMRWQAWPAESLNPFYITDGAPVTPAGVPIAPTKALMTGASDIVSGGGPQMQALQGAVVREPLVKGEPIVKGKIVVAGQGGFMSVVLQPGMRAMSIAVSPETGAGGFVQPGDRVDVLEAHTDSNHKLAGGYVAETVVSNVRVLAVDQSTGPAKNGKSTVAATVTLEVPAASAPGIAEARTRGGAMLALRSYADMGGGPGGSSTASAGHGIRLFKGGQESEVTVSR